MSELWFRRLNGSEYFMRVPDNQPRIAASRKRLAEALNDAIDMAVMLTGSGMAREVWVANKLDELELEDQP